ncbi:MAG: vitamin K epoxide reductase family protein [Amnibacterium sp.]
MIDQGTAVLDEDRRGAGGLQERGRPIALAILLIVGGLLGLLAAFELTLDKFATIQNANAHLSCNFNLLVQCGKNLASPEGSAFGFPNPIIGLVCFPAPVFVGVSVLAGARFPRWFWAVFNAGMLFAIGFVVFLITVSIFLLGTLCPWCMLVWSVVIPMFVATTLFNLSWGHLGGAAGLRRFGSALYGWTPLITLLLYVVVAVIAQLRLNVLSYL